MEISFASCGAALCKGADNDEDSDGESNVDDVLRGQDSLPSRVCHFEHHGRRRSKARCSDSQLHCSPQSRGHLHRNRNPGND